MIVQIHDNLLVLDVQDRFSKCFPGLKIEFYSKRHHFREKSPEEFIIKPSKKIGEIRNNMEEGCLEIKSWYTVARVEKDLRDHYGLNAQIFRRERGRWVQTARTDDYTLREQTEMAEKEDHSFFPAFSDQLGEFDYL